MDNLLDTYKLLTGRDRITITNGPYEIYLARLSKDTIYYSVNYNDEFINEDILDTKRGFQSIIDFARILVNYVNNNISHGTNFNFIKEDLRHFILK